MRVTLNVGGKLFETSKETLMKIPDSLLCGLVEFCDGDEIFIDRDPNLFHHILNYYRNLKFNKPEDKTLCKNIQLEFDYFGIRDPIKYYYETLDDYIFNIKKLEFKEFEFRGCKCKLYDLIYFPPITIRQQNPTAHCNWLGMTEIIVIDDMTLIENKLKEFNINGNITFCTKNDKILDIIYQKDIKCIPRIEIRLDGNKLIFNIRSTKENF